jgi:hypothetical protein
MEVGAIGFHDRTKVKRMKVEKDNTIVNKINKTKEVLLPTLHHRATLTLAYSSLDSISKPARASRTAGC